MADISSITLPGGGTYDLKDKNAVPKYGMGKNLLRNWYFVGGGTGRGVFPVNQRGQSSYYGNNVYGIDGWYTYNGLTAELDSEYLDIYANSSLVGRYYQRLSSEHISFLTGKTCTLSVLTDVGLFHNTENFNPTSTSFIAVSILDSSDTEIGSFFLNGGSSGTVSARFNVLANNSIHVIAVKLELGTESTLAHQENGVLVLNEIPDYEYELYRCITSTADSNDTYANKSLAARQDLTSIQATGITNTTGAVIPSGAYFYLNGILCRAKEQIAVNATFTVNTNCEQVTEGGFNTLNDDLSTKSRQMTKQVQFGKSVDILINGNAYGPFHGFFVICTGNSGRVMTAWLCLGLGTRSNYHFIEPLHQTTGSSLTLTSTVDGKYTFSNNDSAYTAVMTVTMLQEINGSLTLSDPY